VNSVYFAGYFPGGTIGTIAAGLAYPSAAGFSGLMLISEVWQHDPPDLVKAFSSEPLNCCVFVAV
jgi:hypothetical protein